MIAPIGTTPRRVFDTAVKHLVRHGCEAMIPAPLFATIAPSCHSRWRRETSAKYTGHELNAVAAAQLDLLQRFARDRRAQQVFAAYSRLMNVMIGILRNAGHFQQALRNAKEPLVHAVERCAATIGVERAIRLFRISRSTYQHWLQQVKFSCDHSALLLCARRYPQQLLASEVRTVRKLLLDPERAHWPISSIALLAGREGRVHASVQTWYRYAALLGIKRAKRRKERYPQGVRTAAPDRIWHADVTVRRTADGIKHYIYFVQDNFARRILASRVSTMLSGLLRVATLQEAWTKAVAVRGAALHTDLIVDGGPENVNQVMDAFLDTPGMDLHRRIALKEILCSNSMIEAANKCFKYRYLPNDVADGAALQRAVDRFVRETNSIRPQQVLNGFTPDEKYFGHASPADHLGDLRNTARNYRLVAHAAERCGKCR